jgi:hypothetical protein
MELIMETPKRRRTDKVLPGDNMVGIRRTDGTREDLTRLVLPPLPPRNVCPKCDSHRTRIVGQSGKPPLVHRKCEDCEHVFSCPLHDGLEDLDRTRPAMTVRSERRRYRSDNELRRQRDELARQWEAQQSGIKGDEDASGEHT